MNQLLKYSSLALAILAIMSFKVISLDYAGTYGVSDADPSQIELNLNTDYTFHFKDFSNAHSKIDTHGTWRIKNGYVILENFESPTKIHSKWRIDGECKIAKSRKGLTFYTLIRIR